MIQSRKGKGSYVDKQNIKKITEDLELMEGLSRAYANIASTRMQSVRGTVLSSRDFLLALDEIFAEVRESFRAEVKKLSKKRTGGAITFIPHNGKTASVFLSANTGLYGDVIQKTFNLFAEEFRTKGTEATVVGKLGLSLFLGAFPKTPYTYFDFPDYGTNKDNLSNIIKHLVQYDEIHIFFGKFRSLVNQEPNVYNISAQNPFEAAETTKKTGKKIDKYLFEPSLEEILVFFETEMFTSLFEQSISEGQLAKFASRMIAMDRAGENIKDELKKVRLERMRILHSEQNKKITNTFASIALWR